MQADVKTDIKQIRSELIERLGRDKYDVWFSNSDFLLNDGCLTVLSPNAFMSGMLRKTFFGDIHQCAKAVSGAELTVLFDVSCDANGVKNQAVSPVSDRRAAKAAPLVRPVVVDSHDAAPAAAKGYKHTLDAFVVGNKNKMAYNAARIVAETPGKVYNPLFLYGTYGVGKTHLLQAVCNHSKNSNARAVCVYVSAEEFTNEYVNAFRASKLEAFRKKYRSVDILAIDDIHFLANKPSTQEEFLHTFNSIDLADKQIVLASDAHPTMIAELAENLVNRFVSGMVIKIDAPDYDTRLRICRSKILDIGLAIDEQILEYVAANITKSVRDIEGSLLKLKAHTILTGEKLTLPIAEYILGQAVGRASAALRSEDVEACAAAFFGITVKDMRSLKKDQTVSLARAVAMYLLRENTDMSFPEIGKAIGGKNHATAIMSCKKIKQLVEKNNSVKWKANGRHRSENINSILKELTDTLNG